MGVRPATLALCCACATATPEIEQVQPRQEVSEVETNAPALQVPKIISVMPDSGVVDLGPVLIRATAKRTDSYFQALVLAADELGADAFLADSKRMGDAYRFRPMAQRDLMDNTSRPVSADDLILHGPYAASGEAAPSKEYFYHALKYVDDQTIACSWPASSVPTKVRRDLEGVSTLSDQFRVLNGAFATGLLTVDEFRSLRTDCVQQLR